MFTHAEVQMYQYLSLLWKNGSRLLDAELRNPSILSEMDHKAEPHGLHLRESCSAPGLPCDMPWGNLPLSLTYLIHVIGSAQMSEIILTGHKTPIKRQMPRNLDWLQSFLFLFFSL